MNSRYFVRMLRIRLRAPPPSHAQKDRAIAGRQPVVQSLGGKEPNTVPLCILVSPNTTVQRQLDQTNEVD